MNKKFLLFISALLCLSFLTACTDNEERKEPQSQPSDQQVQNENAYTETTASGAVASPQEQNTAYVTKYKRYEIRVSEDDYYIVFIRYREGSTKVAEFTGAFGYPNDRADIEDMIASDDSLKNQIESLGIETASVTYSRLSSGVKGNFEFVELDTQGNDACINMAAQYLSMPLESDFSFNIQNCENALIELGFTLVDNN